MLLCYNMQSMSKEFENLSTAPIEEIAAACDNYRAGLGVLSVRLAQLRGLSSALGDSQLTATSWSTVNKKLRAAKQRGAELFDAIPHERIMEEWGNVELSIGELAIQMTPSTAPHEHTPEIAKLEEQYALYESVYAAWPYIPEMSGVDNEKPRFMYKELHTYAPEQFGIIPPRSRNNEPYRPHKRSVSWESIQVLIQHPNQYFTPHEIAAIIYEGTSSTPELLTARVESSFMNNVPRDRKLPKHAVFAKTLNGKYILVEGTKTELDPARSRPKRRSTPLTCYKVVPVST